MKNSNKKNLRTSCPNCSVKFSKHHLTCPFCDKLIVGNVPYFITIYIGVLGAILLAVFTVIAQF